MSQLERFTPPGVRAPYIPKGVETIEFEPVFDTRVEVVVGDSSHSGFERALQLEHDTFVRLEDKLASDGPDNEFDIYNPSSTIAYAYIADSPFSKLNNDNLVGMARFVPWTVEHGNKTVVDLARIPLSTTDVDTRRAILTAAHIDPEADDITFGAIYNNLLKRLCTENGACREELLVDVATLAPDYNISKKQRMAVNMALLGTTTMYLLRAEEELMTRGEGFSHFTQFTETRLYHAMRSLGYPSDPIAQLESVFYDTAGDGVAMRANPQITRISDLRNAVHSAADGSHFDNIETIYENQIVSRL